MTVELVCHGVPSPGFFRKYLLWLEKQVKYPITNFRFRTKDKRPTGEHSQFRISYNGRDHYRYAYSDPYYSSFLKGKTLRPSCYNCKYKGNQRVGDITIGDFWGIEKYLKSFPVMNGTNLVMINTIKGSEVWKSVSERFIVQESNYEKACKCNPSLDHSTKAPSTLTNYRNPKLFDEGLMPKFNLKAWLKNVIPWRLKLILKKI